MPCFFLCQVLATVKNQIEDLAASRRDLPELITAAQHWLMARETLFMPAGDNATQNVFCAGCDWNRHTDS